MFGIISRQQLNDNVIRLVIDAPLIARKAEPGQFIILRTEDEGERIPLTISDYSREEGTIALVVQVIGASTVKLSLLKVGDSLHDLVGPLGVPTHTEGFKRVAVVGGGVGCAIAYPVAKKLYSLGTVVDIVAGFRNKDLVILEDEMRAISSQLLLMTDDGSYGRKGLVTDALKELIEGGAVYDEVIAIGPLVMMKFVSALTKGFGVKTVVSMNPIMIDGTGMCGGCRLTVGGKMRFACVDGPDFDGHLVDFDEAISRSQTYRAFEKHTYDEACGLMKGTH
jgi:ferredoxin/flavodoxin---NADP+ reductase